MWCRFPTVPVSSPVSVFDAVGRGDYVCPVALACSMAGRSIVSLGGSFLAVRGAGRFGRFFHMELLGGLFVGGVRLICVGTSVDDRSE